MAALHKSIRENIAGFHSESAKRKIVTSRASGFAAALASSLETATETEICLTMQHNLPWPMGKQFYREWWRVSGTEVSAAPPVSGSEVDGTTRFRSRKISSYVLHYIHRFNLQRELK